MKQARGIRMNNCTREADDFMERDVGNAKANTNSGHSGHARYGDEDLLSRDMANRQQRTEMIAAAEEAVGVKKRAGQTTYTRNTRDRMCVALLAAWKNDVLTCPFKMGQEGVLITLVRAIRVNPDVATAMQDPFGKGYKKHVDFLSRTTKNGPDAALTVWSKITRNLLKPWSPLAGRPVREMAAQQIMAQRSLDCLWLVTTTNQMLEAPLTMEQIMPFPLEYCASCMTTAGGAPNPQSNHNSLFATLHADKDLAAATGFIPAARHFAASGVHVATFVDGGADNFDLRTTLTASKTVSAVYDHFLEASVHLSAALEAGDGGVVDRLYLVLDPIAGARWDLKFEACHSPTQTGGSDSTEHLVMTPQDVVDKSRAADIRSSRHNKRLLFHNMHAYVEGGGCATLNRWLKAKVNREFVLLSPRLQEGGTVCNKYGASDGTALQRAPVPELSTATAAEGLASSELWVVRCEMREVRQTRAAIGAAGMHASSLQTTPICIVCRCCFNGDMAITSVRSTRECTDVHHGVVVCSKKGGSGPVEPPRSLDLHLLRAALPAGVADALLAAHLATGTRSTQSITAGSKKKNVSTAVTKKQALAALRKLPVEVRIQFAQVGKHLHTNDSTAGEAFTSDLRAVQSFMCQIFADRLQDTTHLTAHHPNPAQWTPSNMRFALWKDGKKHLHTNVYTDLHSVPHTLRTCMLANWFTRASNATTPLPLLQTSPVDSGFTTCSNNALAPAHMQVAEEDAKLLPPQLETAFVCNCQSKRPTVCTVPAKRKDPTKPLRCPCLNANRKCTDLCRCSKNKCANHGTATAAAAHVDAVEDDGGAEDEVAPALPLMDAVAHDALEHATIENAAAGACGDDEAEDETDDSDDERKEDDHTDNDGGDLTDQEDAGLTASEGGDNDDNACGRTYATTGRDRLYRNRNMPK